MMNKPALYDAALAKWGYDAQVLVLAEECSELSASACRFVNHKANGAKLADEAADVEIMLEQLRHNGLACHIDRAKERKLVRLAKRLAMPDDTLPIAEPASSLALLDEAIYHVGEAQSLRMVGECPRKSARHARVAIGRLMYAAQLMIREAQQQERAANITCAQRAEAQEQNQ
ncbi:hypothetical protein [Serratia nevei]|uniref:hypothetical protein n=1 Tax=Serratia nevei TaxID=2703794 RepID=UPI00285F4A74|nr:hypothetical protein [Serratia nevei]MDR8533024.1 hypothetical protein [Serratia nevei]